MTLDSAAAIATIVGTVITVIASILALLGKLRLRLPGTLSTVESRAIFVLSTTIIALPILAWGPRWGLAPAVANLLIVPSLPAYFDRYSVVSQDEPQGGEVTGITVMFVSTLLLIINVAAAVSLVDQLAN
jgi:hypothetical protein